MRLLTLAIAFLMIVSITASAYPATASNGLIVNGGFETGTLDGWQVRGAPGVVRYPHSGQFSVRLGSPRVMLGWLVEFNGSAEISQSFLIPYGEVAQLSFWYLSVPGNDATTVLNATLIAQNGTMIQRWNQIIIDGEWHQARWQIGAAYSNQTLTIKFLAVPDTIYLGGTGRGDLLATAYVYLDDISVTYG